MKRLALVGVVGALVMPVALSAPSQTTPVQRVDLTVDGRLLNVNQLSTNKYLIERVKTQMQKAQKVVITRHEAAPTPPPTTTTVSTTPTPAPSPAAHVLFTAWNPSLAQRAAPTWKVAVSADPAFTVTKGLVDTLKAQGHKVYAWGNQSQITPQRLQSFAAGIGADGIIYQAETQGELQQALDAHATLVVGNPNAWTAQGRADFNASGALLLCEVYTNTGHPWPDAYGTQGVPVAAWIYGLYQDLWRPLLTDYFAHTTPGAASTYGVYTAETLQEADWAALAR